MIVVGDLLPVWMFINSLSLIAHTPLLNSQMPGNVQYFLSDYLQIVRLRDPVYDRPAPVVQNEHKDQGRLLQASMGLVSDPSEGVKEYSGAYNMRF